MFFHSLPSLTLAVVAAMLTAASATVYEEPEVLCHLDDKDIDESSGLEFSTADREVFWTHNDDEDDDRLFAVNLDGETLAVHRLKGIRLKDWEDISTFKMDGVSYLVCADSGNKDSKRRDGHLYFFKEPEKPDHKSDLKVLSQVAFHYDDGYHNCEAVAVDVTSASILLATKTDDDHESALYVLPLDLSPGDDTQKAQHIATLGIPKITAMDISSDGRRAIILADEDVFEVERDETESWGEAAGKDLVKVAELPKGQWEAVCYGADDRTLYMTTEKKETRVMRVRPSGNP